MKLKNFSPKAIILKEINSLKPKEVLVLLARFGIKGKEKTLAAIGRDLKLSRERVRQIEKDALKKISLLIVQNHNNVVLELTDYLVQNGGIISTSVAGKKLLPKENINDEQENKALHLLLLLLPEIEKIVRHNDVHDSFVLKSLSKADVVSILNDWAKYLKNSKKPETIQILIEKHPDHQKQKITFLSNLPSVSRKIIETYEGTLALSEWSDYNPRTVRDKIYYVLKKNQKPMHFNEITRSIRLEEFDLKKVVSATVHNELISDSRFVLIGRGIYALSEWGYKSGTVRDIIKSILERDGALAFEDVYKKVSEQRVVRKNTVLINLQTQKEFKKIGQDLYTVA